MHGDEVRDMPPDEFAHIPDEYREKPHDALAIIAGTPQQDLNRFGYATAELVRRDREFQREMSSAADNREISRQKFDEDLAQRQMDHASTLAKEQLDTARSAARAAKWAVWAAASSAVGAIGLLIVALVR
jgi:hypothetical protein